MNAMEAREAKKRIAISIIDKSIEHWIVKCGWTSVIVPCNSDIYEDIKEHFESQGYKMWRERIDLPDMDGFITSNYVYHTYIGIQE